MVPTAALFLVEIDANEGLGVRAMNLAQAVVEYDAITFTDPAIHVVIFCGLLFSPQQSCTVVVPGSALNPAGHVVQTDALAFENVSAAQVVQELAEIAASSG
jgi:hypothetical protein